MDYYSLFWAPGVISTINEPRGAFTCRSSTLTVLANSGPFLGLLLCFWVSARFPCLTNTGVHLCVAHQHSQFWPILARFVEYYALFWGIEVISTINEPRGAFTFRSSTLTLLSDSCLFCILLLTVLGSRSDFHD